MLFTLNDLRHVYVSSARRGFLAVADNPMCVTSVSGGGASSVIIGIKRVERRDGAWVYSDPATGVDWWMKKAWLEAIALQGGEPWRVYEMDAAKVAGLLDDGVFTDDIRGFKSRNEPWQPMLLTAGGEFEKHVGAPEATAWERRDGWRAVVDTEGVWHADGQFCIADRSMLESSPNHFDRLPRASNRDAVAVMEYIDVHRPFD